MVVSMMRDVLTILGRTICYIQSTTTITEKEKKELKMEKDAESFGIKTSGYLKTTEILK